MSNDCKQYVKKGLWTLFKKHCQTNSTDFYGCGCVLTAHLVLEDLMRHTKHKDTNLREEKMSPKDAWCSAMKSTPYHSGFSAMCTAQIIVKFSPRGQEFKKWWKKEYEN